MKKVLTIAGSDSSGGAGIQADLKTFAAHNVYGMSVITAITAQNTIGVLAVENVSEDMVRKQAQAVFEDLEVDAVKIGMLSDLGIITSVCQVLRTYSPPNVVIDPVMVSSSGFDLLNTQAKDLLVKDLLPLADLITPNLSEARCIIHQIDSSLNFKLDTVEDMEFAARYISGYTHKNVLIKGGHLSGKACDVLVLYDGKTFYFEENRIKTKNTHGTGCTLSSAIAANLAEGMNVDDAVRCAKEFITTSIKYSLDIGHGAGPLNPFGKIFDK